jgi:hypothetical protein
MNAPVNTEESQLVAAPSRQQFDLSPRTFEQALTFADYLADSDLVPKDFKGKPGNCLIAMQWGSELGLKPLQALQNLAIINGRPSLWGDAVIALVRSSAACEYVIETQTAEAATCRVKRRGEPEQERTFTMADAAAAGLKNKQGPWTQYPKRMMQMRARAFALRDVFPDVLRGLPVAEEIMDTPTGTPPEKHMGNVDEVKPAAKPGYTPEQFAENMTIWKKVIASKKKTVDQVLATIATVASLTDEQTGAIRALEKPLIDAATGEVVMTFAHVADKLNAAKDMDKLAEAASLISAVADEKQRKELEQIYERRGAEINS